MDALGEIKETWIRAQETMNRQEFEAAASLYKKALTMLHEVERDPVYEPAKADIRSNLGNGYCDLSVCLLNACGTEINEAAHAITVALLYGCKTGALKSNLLYCMSMANRLMSARMVEAPDIAEREQFVRYHNNGYDLLKTPDPPGTAGRNWEGAVNSYRAALELLPESAGSCHGLGLAYEGLKRDDEAIDAWLRVEVYDPGYAFGCRVKYTVG